MATTTATFVPPPALADLFAAPDAPEPAPSPADVWEYESWHAPTPAEERIADVVEACGETRATAEAIARGIREAQIRQRAADAALLARLLTTPIRPRPQRLYPGRTNVDYRGVPLRNCYE